MDREKILKEMNELMKRAEQTDFDTDEYERYQKQLSAWQDILDKIDAVERAEAKDKRQRKIELTKAWIDLAKTGLAVGGTLAGICVIVCAEEAVPKILTSKAMSWVTKILPKVV